MTPLSREQVQQLADQIANGQLNGYINQWLEHDAAFRARVEELEQRQAWIDTVGPPDHPDDERHWVGAYLTAQQQLTAAKEREARLWEWVVRVYHHNAACAAGVAFVCDEWFDRSGKTLGEIRDLAALKEAP